jgi:hypothetical protein
MNPPTSGDTGSGAVVGSSAGRLDEPGLGLIICLITQFMNPARWGFVRSATLSTTSAGPVPTNGSRGSLTLHDSNREPPTLGFRPSCDS